MEKLSREQNEQVFELSCKAEQAHKEMLSRLREQKLAQKKRHEQEQMLQAKIDRQCEGCYYYKRLVHDLDYKVCHYILIENEPRGCPADGCTKKRVDAL